MAYRAFEISTSLAARLASRATAEGITQSELIHNIISNFNFLNPVIDFSEQLEETSLRNYRLDESDDRQLGELAVKLDLTKGKVFRNAIRWGLIR